ncbi:zonular occludens toxin domain-containing protein [Psychrobacter urativorans]|uniref:zonular occludens toxin domain-containing protein n=1 Tax=Psychrobacter urativorans TaxID=45610 RepID=UPI001917EAA3|nr:zonular occludens toxin domain-containing protein [Psychrobacter urativorans]
MSSILGRSSILITGLEGSGKSHFVMSQIKQILDMPDNEYEIYLANVDGVALVDAQFHVVQPEFSWVDDAPKNSIVIYDEAGTIERFNNTKTKINSHIDVETLTMRRHKNVLVIFVTQDAKLVHSGLRSLIKFHFHFSNPYSSRTETKCFITAGVNDSSPKKTIIEEFDHKLDPTIFPLYKSVDEGVKHDQKTVKNKKAVLMQRIAILSLILAIPIFIGMFFLIKKVRHDQFDTESVNAKVNSKVADTAKDFSDRANPTTQTNGDVTLQQNNYDATRSLELYKERLPDNYRATVNNDDLRVSGVVMMRGNCKAYNGHGEFINISQIECVGYTETVGSMPKANRNGQRITNQTGATEENDDPEKNRGSNEVIANPIPIPQNPT